MENSWIILRTSGRSTLVLAKSLEEDGFEVWTPVRTQVIRVPRMNVRREVRLPLLPSFVFVRAHHLHGLLELEKMAVKPRRLVSGERHSQPAHRSFSVFRYLDQIPTVADRHLEPLRQRQAQLQRLAVPKSALPRFDRGQRVRVTRGVYQGCVGKVERCKDGLALVLSPAWNFPVKIPTWLLSEDEALSATKPTLKAA